MTKNVFIFFPYSFPCALQAATKTKTIAKCLLQVDLLQVDLQAWRFGRWTCGSFQTKYLESEMGATSTWMNLSRTGGLGASSGLSRTVTMYDSAGMVNCFKHVDT